MRNYLSLLVLVVCSTALAQENIKDKLPYASIPEAPENFTPGTVVSRVIDGLGFRYYWASEGLTANDLKYAPGNDGRSIDETIEHIYGLSNMILNAAKNTPNGGAIAAKTLTSAEQRQKSLENFKEASEIFTTSTDLNNHNIIFGTTSFPLWNAMNGPIEDAVWHAGQLVVMRRSAGNPINSKVNVFLGKLNE